MLAVYNRLVLGNNYRLLAKKDAKGQDSVYFKLLSQNFSALVKAQYQIQKFTKYHTSFSYLTCVLHAQTVSSLLNV